MNHYLNTVLSIKEPALNLILSELTTRKTYTKNEVIYHKGKIPLELSFLESGNAMALSQSKPRRQVLRFWVAKQLICPCGFFCNIPSSQSIIALDDCVVSVLSFQSLLKFQRDFPEGYKITNEILRSEINLVELNIKSLLQNKMPQEHEAFLEALSITFDE